MTPVTALAEFTGTLVNTTQDHRPQVHIYPEHRPVEGCRLSAFVYSSEKHPEPSLHVKIETGAARIVGVWNNGEHVHVVGHDYRPLPGLTVALPRPMELVGDPTDPLVREIDQADPEAIDEVAA